MIVRVYVPTWQDLKVLDARSLDIAAGRYGEWYDLVVDQQGLSDILASGLPYEVTVPSIDLARDEARGEYCSYADMVDSLITLSLNYPDLCQLDSLPFPTYEGRWIYGVKISDNVSVEEYDEPKFTLDGCHHSREWATPQAVLFFADSMLASYGIVSELTEIINTTEMYCFPVINVDGYVHDYGLGGDMWRKNREPFGGYIGTDCNRNYGGACNGEVDGYWGAADEDQVSHRPDHQTFCGQYAFSGDEIWAYTTFIRERRISTGFSLHSYGEQVMYPWGYKAAGTPDAALYDAKGAHMAGMMQGVYGGTYTPGQSYNNPYPTCGNTRDWVYGYNKWVAGVSSLFYGAEIGISFYENVSNLDFISRQVFKAASYLAGFSDSLVLVAEGFVAPPVVYPLGAVDEDFTISWHAKNSFDNNPVQWELVELSGLTVILDDLETGTDRWILEGFTHTTAQSHSSTHSFFSGDIPDMNHAVRTAYPYIVQPGDSLTFWCRYDLETNYDVAVVEISENGKEWLCLADRFNGSSAWTRRAYSLEDWIGTSVYFRFRAMTDGLYNNGGFYVDDISPVCAYATVDTITSTHSDTTYDFVGHEPGVFYYYVKGYNAAHGWGDYSRLQQADVTVGIAEIPGSESFTDRLTFHIRPNPFQGRALLYVNGLSKDDHMQARFSVYNSTGQMIKTIFETVQGGRIVCEWDATDHMGRSVPAGVYYVRLQIDGNNNTHDAVERIVLVR